MNHRKPILFCAALVAAVSALRAQEAAPAGKRVIPLVELSGIYRDLPEAGLSFASMLGAPSKPKPFYALVDKLGDLAGHESATVLFDLSRPVALNLAQLAELERAITALREAGKKCYAYLENAGFAQYQVACRCDEILLADMSVVDLRSPSLTTMFFKDAMDLLGIRVDVVRVGDFKGAAEPYTRSAMSRHLREHYRAMLETMNEEIVRRIAGGRGLDERTVRGLQARRLLTAQEARREGLVDRLVPWRGAGRALRLALEGREFELSDVMKEKRPSVNFLAMMNRLFRPREAEDVEEETVVVLHLSGAIVDGSKDLPGQIVSGPAVKRIRALAADDEVEAVVVRINSPGGSATASEAIVLALADLARAKPVVCSMGAVAASGGYYVTCFGRPILAERGTITGSIGVFGMKPNLGPLMRRFGVREEIVALDEGATMDALASGWTDEQKARVQAFVDEVYERFVGRAAESRGMAQDAIRAVAGGRVWSGGQAVERGLVDRIGGLEEALAMVREEAQLGEDVEVTHLPRPRSFFEVFAEMFARARALVPGGFARSALRRLGEMPMSLTILLDALRDERATYVWAFLPAELRVR